MDRVSSVSVIANVRTDGAIGKFERRTFDLMVDVSQPQDKQMKEVIRILRQLGYETRGVEWEPNPGN